MTKVWTDRRAASNSSLEKVAVFCSEDPKVSGWLIKHWFSASIPTAIGMVKITTFAKPQNISGHAVTIEEILIDLQKMDKPVKSTV